MQGSSELCHIKKWSDLIIIFLWSGYHEEANTIFWWYSGANEQSWSIHWILLDVFFYIQLSFSIFYGFKSQLANSYDNWYVQKYLKGIFHKGMLLICKEYFMHTILSFSSPRCAIIAHLNVIYTKFRHAMIAQLNKIWHVWACACAITCHSRPGLILENLIKLCMTELDFLEKVD